MNRIEIYNQMKKFGIKHYIVSATQHSARTGRPICTWTHSFHKAHGTEESFEAEIQYLRKLGFDQFDVIHLHE